MEKINCIIIHGCPTDEEKAMNPETRTYDKHWLPWTREQLTLRGVKTETPLMPEPWAPDYEKFKKEFEKYAVSENTILIGTSCGCAFLVRWLGEAKKKIKKLILVAPWKYPDEEKKEWEGFYVYDVDKTIRERVDEIIMFTSDNEAAAGKKSLQIFHATLGGEIIELQGRGHYLLRDMGTVEFPELIESVLR